MNKVLSAKPARSENKDQRDSQARSENKDRSDQTDLKVRRATLVSKVHKAPMDLWELWGRLEPRATADQKDHRGPKVYGTPYSGTSSAHIHMMWIEFD